MRWLKMFSPQFLDVTQLMLQVMSFFKGIYKKIKKLNSKKQIEWYGGPIIVESKNLSYDQPNT